MSSLQDLCVSKIEESGNDTHEVLKEVKEELPERLWARHPSLHIVVLTRDTIIDPPEEEIGEDTEFTEVKYWIKKEIRLEYTGVYTLRFNREIQGWDHKDQTVRKLIMEKGYGATPEIWEKKFESLTGELSKDQEENVRRMARVPFMSPVENEPIINLALERAKKNILVTEMMRLIFEFDFDRICVRLANPTDTVVLTFGDFGESAEQTTIENVLGQGLNFLNHCVLV